MLKKVTAIILSALILLSFAGCDIDTEGPAGGPQTNGAYKSGTYKVGTDIDAGEYFVTCTNSISCYVEVSSDSSGSFESIVTNDNVATFSFITVADGQYLKINGGEFVKAVDAKVPGADSNGVYGAGTYRVGTDIPAGEYKVTCTNEINCYVEVASDSTGTFESIVTNANTTSTHYITVTVGQYLEVSGGQFAPAE